MTTPPPAIAHGGDLGAARRRWPNAPEPWIDLSTGINPVPYEMPALDPADFARLPGPDAMAGLQTIAAAAYGVGDPAMVVAAPGTQILISLLPLLIPSPHVRVLGPTYAEHAASWTAAGARVEQVSEFADLACGHTAVVVNPNNPDGRRTDPVALLNLADRLARAGGHVIVDEAFADLEGPGLSAVPSLPHPGLVVLRSFGKTYGLAGVRLGFLIAEPRLADKVRTALGPWAVSCPAIAAGKAALADRAWLQTTATRLRADQIRLDAWLHQAGSRVLGGTLLYRLAAAPPGLHDRLGRAGILVRSFDERPGLLRFGIPGDAASWSRLEAVKSSIGVQ